MESLSSPWKKKTRKQKINLQTICPQDANHISPPTSCLWCRHCVGCSEQQASSGGLIHISAQPLLTITMHLNSLQCWFFSFSQFMCAFHNTHCAAAELYLSFPVLVDTPLECELGLQLTPPAVCFLCTSVSLQLKTYRHGWVTELMVTIDGLLNHCKGITQGQNDHKKTSHWGYQ